MDVRLPNGTVIRGVPEGTTKAQIQQKAIAAGLASTEDFAQPKSIEESTTEQALIGLGRGFKDVGEGVAQVGLNTGEAIRDRPFLAQGLRGLSGVPGIGPLLAGGAAVSQQIPQGASEEFTRKAQQERALFEQGMGDSTAATVGRVAGNVLPALAAPTTGVVRSLPQLARAVGGEAAIGAGQAATEFVPEGEDRLTTAATGGLLGAGGRLGFEGLASAGRGAANKVLGPGTNQEVAERAALAEKAGVDLSQGDLFGGTTRQMEQNLFDRLPLIGTRRTRDRQAQQFERAGRRGVAGIPGGTVDDPGEAVIASIRRTEQQNEAAVSKIFKRVTKLAREADDPVIDMNRTRQAANRQIEKLTQNPETNISPQILTRLQQFSEAPPRSFEQANLLRSELYDDIRALSRRTESVLTNREKAALTDMADSIDKDMTQWARKQGGSIEKLWRQGNEKFRELVVPLRQNKQLAKLIAGDIPAGEVFARFIKQDARLTDRSGKARELTEFLDRGGKKASQFSVLSDAFERSFTNEGAFLPSKFANELDRFSTASKGVFNEKQMKQLDGLKKLMQMGESVSRVQANPLNGSSLFQMVAAGVGLGAGSLASQLGLGTESSLAVGGLGLTSVLLTSQRGRRLLTKIATRNLNKASNKEKAQLAQQISEAIADNIRKAPSRFLVNQESGESTEAQTPQTAPPQTGSR